MTNMSYVLTKDKQPVGFYDTFPEALQALEAEREKEDGVLLEIEQEKEAVE